MFEELDEKIKGIVSLIVAAVVLEIIFYIGTNPFSPVMIGDDVWYPGLMPFIFLSLIPISFMVYSIYVFSRE